MLKPPVWALSRTSPAKWRPGTSLLSGSYRMGARLTPPFDLQRTWPGTFAIDRDGQFDFLMRSLFFTELGCFDFIGKKFE